MPMGARRAIDIPSEPPSWRVPLVALVLVIVFIPIRRYTMPVELPFELEPYRLLVAVLALVWLVSLLVDPRVRLHRSGLELPLVCFLFAAMASVLVNDASITQQGLDISVVKSLTFFGSFVLIFYLVVSVASSFALLDFLAKLLVGSGALVAVVAVAESRTGYNPFDHLAGTVPFLELSFPPDIQARGARLRAYASAQHPIALAAALVMLVPLAVYLAHATAKRRWWAAAVLLIVGALSTVSRTSIVMLVVVIAVFLWLRPRETMRLWPALLPALVLVHLVIPGTIGTLRASFFPQGGLVEEQSAAGRIEDFAPSKEEFRRQPLLGQGFGTRQVTGEHKNARFLDNQWLGPCSRRASSERSLSLLALHPLHPAYESRGEQESDVTRLAAHRNHGFGHGVRRRDADLRLVLVHPGDVPAVHPARLRLGAHLPRLRGVAAEGSEATAGAAPTHALIGSGIGASAAPPPS